MLMLCLICDDLKKEDLKHSLGKTRGAESRELRERSDPRTRRAESKEPRKPKEPSDPTTRRAERGEPREPREPGSPRKPPSPTAQDIFLAEATGNPTVHAAWVKMAGSGSSRTTKCSSIRSNITTISAR